MPEKVVTHGSLFGFIEVEDIVFWGALEAWSSTPTREPHQNRGFEGV